MGAKIRAAKIRAAVKIGGEIIPVPAKFWRLFSDEDWDRVFAAGGWLDSQKTELLWRITERQGEAPGRLQVFVKSVDVTRWLRRREAGKNAGRT